MNPNKRNYRATFILDTNGVEETVEQIIENVKQEIATVEGEVGEVENLGLPQPSPNAFASTKPSTAPTSRASKRPRSPSPTPHGQSQSRPPHRQPDS